MHATIPMADAKSVATKKINIINTAIKTRMTKALNAVSC